MTVVAGGGRRSNLLPYEIPVIALLCLLAACGSIGDPLPPMSHIPQLVDDLSARQVADEVVIAWSWPLLTTEGATARRLEQFVVYAVNAAPDAVELQPEAIGQHGRELAVVGANDLADKSPGDRIEVELPLADWELDQNFILVVTSKNRAGRSGGYSNQVRLKPVIPPQAPALAEPVVSAEGVTVFWEKPDTAGVFAVERLIEGDQNFTVVARIDQNSYLDRGAQWDRAHQYRVRSFARTGAVDAEGQVSKAVNVTPADTFPPAVPRGLRAVSTVESIELSWDGNRDVDLAGYIVYRDGQKISETVSRASFSDRESSPGADHSYAVAAVDNVGNESARTEAVQTKMAAP